MSAAAEAYLWTLYSRCDPADGEIVLVDSTARRPIGFYPVTDLDRLATDIRLNPGCFIKVNLMDGEAIAARQAEKVRQDGFGWTVGRIAEVKTIIGLHLDVDAAKSEKYLTREQAIACLKAMPVEPTLTVSTDGDNGGFHSYWSLQKPVRIESEADRKQWQSTALRWQNRLKEIALDVGGKSIDSTANIDRVLRPVGSLRVSGNRVLNYGFSGQFFRPEDFYIPPTDAEIQDEAKVSVKALFRDVLGPINATGSVITDYIDAAGITPQSLLSEAGYTQLNNPMEWRRPDAASAGRSLKIATELDRSGINMFSGGDPLFGCLKRDGSVGRFHSVDAMFVILRHGGDWKAAARWCAQQIGDSIRQQVNLEAIVNG